jgi:cell division septal protein FtsQ
MLRKLDKKNYIFFLLIVFLILSSTHNSNFKYNNFFNVKKIEVVGLNKTDNAFLENEFTDLVGSNIFTLNKKSFELINSVNRIKSYNVKKIYPNQVKIYLESAQAIGFVKNINELVILGNNGKIIEPETLPKNIPEVTGTNDMKKIFQTIEIIKKSDFDIRKIKKINFFPSKRIDIEFENKKKIKFPINFKVDDLNFGFRVINNEKFNQVKIIDLRIPNKVITDD